MSAAISMGAAITSGYVIDPPRLRVSPQAPSFSTSSIQNEEDRKWKKSIDELLELRQIGDNWDGEGARGPIPELVDSAIEFLKSKRYGTAPSRTVPINDGRIALEWDAPGYFVNLRIESHGRGNLMIIWQNGRTDFSTVDL